MKIGDLVKGIWTEGCDTAPAVIGIVTKMRQSKGRWCDERQRVELFANGKRSWLERGDLKVVA